MKRKLSFYLLTALLSLVSIAASAHDFKVDGIYYNYNDGSDGTSVSVTHSHYSSSSPGCYSGDVNIPSFVIYNDKTYSVTSIDEGAFTGSNRLTSVIIPYSVTSIGSYAFRGCISLTSLTIPNGVTTINYQTFYECSGLISIILPSSVTSIGESAFAFCSKLSTINIGNRIVSIGRTAFTECSSLASIIIPNSVTSIGDHAFLRCSNLSTITIPQKVTSIGFNPFDECSGLETIVVESGNTKYDSRENCNAVIETASNTLLSGCKNTITPNSVTSIGAQAFSGCSALNSIIIPNSVTSIGLNAFYRCTGLTFVTIPNSVISIGRNPFAFCAGLETIVVEGGNTIYDSRDNCNAVIETASNTILSGCKNTIIPNNVISIGPGAFQGCSSMSTLTIPSSVKNIGQDAFWHCSGLTSMTIGDNVTIIGGSAFSDCSRLKSVTIPKSVTSIGNYAFNNCTDLTSVIVKINNPISLSLGETFSNRANATLYVPMGSKVDYEATDYWKDFGKIVEIIDVSVSSAEIRTYCSEYALDFTDVPELKAYIASGFSPSTGDLLLTRVYKVPAGVGLILKGEEGDYDIPHTETDMYYANLLKGVLTATTIYPTEGNYVNYILTKAASHGIGFYTLSEAGEIEANKAYLQVPKKNANARAIILELDDEGGYGSMATGIETISIDEDTALIFDLKGRRVNQPKSGLYIINGKKMFVK